MACVCMYGLAIFSVEKRQHIYLLISLLPKLPNPLSKLMADCLQRAGAVCLNVKVIRPSMLQESTEPERDRWVDPRGRVQGQAKSHQPALQPFFIFFFTCYGKLSISV